MTDWQRKTIELHRKHQCGRPRMRKLLAAEGFKIADRTLGRFMQRNCLKGVIQTNEEIQTDFGQTTGRVTTNGSIKTLQQALDAAQVDLTAWEVDRHVVNFWGDKTQVKVWLKRLIAEPKQKALEALVSRLAGQAVTMPEPRRQAASDPHMLEISLYDHHFGKLAWAAETGTDYDLKIAESLFVGAVESLLQKTSGYQLDKILLPVGQDFFHINNPQGTTAKGTRQDTDSRLAKIFEVGQLSVIQAVERCRQIAPVEVIWVPGNHDPETSYYLVKVIEAYYRTTEGVTVDASPRSRKFRKYGTTLLGFTHSDKEKISSLPLNMAGSAPMEWATTTHHEWHVGHLHKKGELSFVAGDSFGPVQVRRLPSLCGTDAWHFENGYVNGSRAAEAYLWSFANGYTGHFSVSERELNAA